MELKERSPEAKAAYIEGWNAAIEEMARKADWKQAEFTSQAKRWTVPSSVAHEIAAEARDLARTIRKHRIDD